MLLLRAGARVTSAPSAPRDTYIAALALVSYSLATHGIKVN